MKRIKVIVPVATSIWNNEILENLNYVKDKDTLIDIINLKTGPEAIEQHYDDIWAELLALKEAEEAEKEGYDGVIIYCFNDPAVRAAKEKLSIPVIGIMEASLHFASMLGRKFSIIATLNEGKTATEDLLRLYGFKEKCASVRTLGMEILELNDKYKLEKAIYKSCEEAIKKDDADVIIFGCGGILGVKEKCSNLGIPIIEPGGAALKLCEDIIELKLSQSKKAYPFPTNIKRT